MHTVKTTIGYSLLILVLFYFLKIEGFLDTCNTENERNICNSNDRRDFSKTKFSVLERSNSIDTRRQINERTVGADRMSRRFIEQNDRRSTERRETLDRDAVRGRIISERRTRSVPGEIRDSERFSENARRVTIPRNANNQNRDRINNERRRILDRVDERRNTETSQRRTDENRIRISDNRIEIRRAERVDYINRERHARERNREKRISDRRDRESTRQIETSRMQLIETRNRDRLADTRNSRRQTREILDNLATTDRQRNTENRVRENRQRDLIENRREVDIRERANRIRDTNRQQYNNRRILLKTDENNNERRNQQDRSSFNNENNRRLFERLVATRGNLMQSENRSRRLIEFRGKMANTPEINLNEKPDYFWSNVAKTILASFILVQMVTSANPKKYG